MDKSTPYRLDCAAPDCWFGGWPRSGVDEIEEEHKVLFLTTRYQWALLT